jgi:hypothetical protein
MINIIFGLCWLEKNRKQKVTDAFKILDLVSFSFLQHFGSKQKFAIVLLMG